VSRVGSTCFVGYISEVASTFEVLAEPRRREILDLLLGGERAVGDLVDRLTLSQPAVSKHLRVLREAGLVDVRQDAQRRWYRLRPQPLAEIDAWLAPYRRLWNASLDALERRLDAMPDAPADEAGAGAGAAAADQIDAGNGAETDETRGDHR
jgi:DNA-binding transcriptional ArsR family regulator